MLLKCAPLLLLLGCPTPEGVPDGGCFVGEADGAVELLPIAVDEQGGMFAIADGGSLVLQRPPQGGYVLFAGAAARNLDGCGVSMSAQLLDPATGQSASNLDRRPASLTQAREGYFWPQPANARSQVNNIPVCPDALHSGGITGHTVILRVDAQDVTGRTGHVELPVVPVCRPGDANCACICGPNPGGC